MTLLSHDKPGAVDHSSVDWDVLFHPILSISGLSPGYYIPFRIIFLS